ncbi:hypothetical protein SAMN02910339_02546 [Lachnospiraceae bacterium YSD2013]|nr:hypothetical protein SAMN02910339_02546 [Lachnospiraceae bacterium YSD2013]
MVKKWITRVLVLGIVLFVMFKTKGFFDDLKDGTYAHEIVPVLESQSKNNSSQKENKEKESVSSSAEPAESVVSVPEEVYEPSDKTGDDFYLDLSQIKMWESGEYEETTGEKVEHRRRLRYPDLIAIECPKYNINVSDGYKLRICEYDAEESLIRSMELTDGDVFEPSKEGEFFSVTIMKIGNENSLSPGQWGRVFESGIEVIICTDKWQDFSGEEVGDLITGEKDTQTMGNLSEYLLAGKDDELADIIWDKQIVNGLYTLTAEELDNGNPTYYVSSSGGNDANSGLTPDSPKKNLEFFSGMSNVNVLLKCGDTFRVSKGISLGNDCIYAAYGQGVRPTIDYYGTLDVVFTPTKGIANMWEADLSALDIVTNQEDKKNCNIGQLLIDGDVNWNRYSWYGNDELDPHTVEAFGEGTWAVDWHTSKLYIYSIKDPNNSTIEYAPPVTGLSGVGIKNTIIKGLEIKGAGYHGCYLQNCSNIELSNCYINHIGGSLHNRGSRYGNAVQVWDSGEDIRVYNNYASWIFDTCFTNQGSNNQAVDEHIHFTDNIGAHFFWGIEVWGDGYSENPFNDITYTGNVLFDNVDVTNPDTPMYVKGNARLLGISDEDYISFRTGYKYHQMSGINVSNSGTGQITKIENNIVWNSNRFLVWAGNHRHEEDFSALMNNFFYAEDILPGACLFRYDSDGKAYCETPQFADRSNAWSVHVIGEKYDNSAEKERLNEALLRIAGESNR